MTDDYVIQCPVCYGETAICLGRLAGIPQYRCRHCGIIWSDADYDNTLLAELEENN